MKKLFLLLVFSTAATLLPAQDKQFGLKGGANFSDIMGGNVAKNSHEAKFGWHAGAFLYIKMYSPFFAIQPEILYSRKGYENVSPAFEIRDNQNNLVSTGVQSGQVRLNYIDLPVMFTFRSSLIIFEIGPQFSFLTGVKNDSFVRHTFPDGTATITPLNSFSRTGTTRFDLGLATGFRLQTENGGSIGIRFNQGLVNISRKITDTPLPPNGLNQVFQLYGGFILPF